MTIRSLDRRRYSPWRTTSGPEKVTRLGWSTSGEHLAIATSVGHIAVWNPESDSSTSAKGPQFSSPVSSLDWSQQGWLAACSRQEGRLRIFDSDLVDRTPRRLTRLDTVEALAWSPDGRSLAVALGDEGQGYGRLLFHEIDKGLSISRRIDREWGRTLCLSWAPDALRLASGHEKGTLVMWQFDAERTDSQPMVLRNAHASLVLGVAWMLDGHRVLSWGDRGLVWIWHTNVHGHGGRLPALVAADGPILGGALSPDGLLFATRDSGHAAKVWHTADWSSTGVASAERPAPILGSLAWRPRPQDASVPGPPGYRAELAMSDRDGDDVVVARLPRIIGPEPVDDSAEVSVRGDGLSRASGRFTTAKVVLLGHSGVGKTTLGERLATGRFRPQASTHGQRSWTLDGIAASAGAGVRRDLILWDFAGQQQYRIVHGLSLDGLSLALLLCDAGSDAGLDEPARWARLLRQRFGRPVAVGGDVSATRGTVSMILVCARCDVSGRQLSEAYLDAWCEEHGVDGGFVYVSAKTGDGVEALEGAIRRCDPWGRSQMITSPMLLGRVLDLCQAMRREANRRRESDGGAGPISLTLEDLHDRFEAEDDGDPGRVPKIEEVDAIVDVLAHQGWVRRIVRDQESGRDPARDVVLVQPELTSNLASSLINWAMLETDGPGAIQEHRLYRDEPPFDELKNLELRDRAMLLDAVVDWLLTDQVCMRIHTGRASPDAGGRPVTETNVLLFPELILRQPPHIGEEIAEHVHIEVPGASPNLYAMLVVQIHYIDAFSHVRLGKDRVEYQTPDGVVGFSRDSRPGTSLRLTLFWEDNVAPRTRRGFVDVFRHFLYASLRVGLVDPHARAEDVREFPALVCSDSACGTRLRPDAVAHLLDQQHRHAGRYPEALCCPACGCRIPLPHVGKPRLDANAAGRIEAQVRQARLRAPPQTSKPA